MRDQFRTETGLNESGHFTLITCTLCGVWRAGVCEQGSVIRDLYPLRDKHAELCRIPDNTPDPDPCGQGTCVKCKP